MSARLVSRLATLSTLVLVVGILGCGGGGGKSGGGLPVVNPPPPPVPLAVTAVSPTQGAPAGGTTVTITGTGFSDTANTTVSFGAVPATNVAVTSSTSITCVTPAEAAGAVNVTVNILTPSTTATLTSGFTFTNGGGGGGGGGGVPMTVSSVVPNAGSQNGGTPVTITGTNFTLITAVFFGGAPATLVGFSSTSISVLTPIHAPGLVDLTITSSVNPLLDVPGAFNYTIAAGGGAVTITNVIPSNGPLAGGNTITIEGTGFATGVIGSMVVTFQGVPAGSINVASSTSLSVVVPAQPPAFTGGPVNLTVTDMDGATNPTKSIIGYTYVGVGGAPTLTQITPNSVPQSGNVRVTITGTNFTTGLNSNIASVLIGSQLLQNLDVLSSTTLTGTVPQGPPGPTTVIAFGTGGQPSNTLGFTYTPALLIFSVNPNQGPTAGGGRAVTIKGGNFTQANIASIDFGVTPGTAVNVLDDQTVTVIPPPAPGAQIGPQDVTINGNGIASATLRAGYNYGPAFNAPILNTTLPGSTAAVVTGAILQGQFLPGVTGYVAVSGNKIWFASSFINPVALPLGGGLTGPFVDIAIADLNADGLLDVVVLDQGAKLIGVYLSNGPGSLAAPFTVPVPSGVPVSMALGHFAPSGFYDVAVATQAPDQVLIFQGAAGPTFTNLPAKTVALPANAVPGQILCADPVKSSTDVKQFRGDDGEGDHLDLNGDGHADLAIALAGLDEVGILLQDPKTPFSFSLTSVGPVGTGCHGPTLLAMADLSEHGALDIVAGNTGTNNLSVFIGNGAGAIAFSASYSVSGPGNNVLTGLIIGDFNRDCRQDIVTSSYGGENFSLFFGHGDGTFADAVNYDSELAGFRGFAHVTALAHDTDFEAVYCLDVNNDPMINQELVTFVPRKQIELILGQPVAPAFDVIPVQQDPEAIAFGDLNRDGHLDIVVANRASNTIQVFINDGTGNFLQPFAAIATGLQPESVTIADVNNDGLNDVLVACNSSDAVFVHINLGGGSLGAGTMVKVNDFGPHQVVALDMDGDSTIDFVTVNQRGNSVSVFVNPNGDGNFVPAPGFSTGAHPPGVFPVGNAPLGLAVADLNGDGKPDIVTANSSDDSVTVLLRQPGTTSVVVSSSTDFPLGGIIAPAPSQPAGTPAQKILIVEPVSVAVADLNGDGFPDIVTADKFTSTITILHGGKGGIGGNFFVPMDYVHYGSPTAIGIPPVKLVCGLNPIAVAIADMNDDGFPDIVAGCFGSSNVIDFINQGSKTQSAATGANDLTLKPPSPDVVPFPAGEVAFVFDKKLQQVLYKTGALVSFTAANGAPVTGMALGGLIIPCVPNVGTTAPDNNVRLFQTK